VARVAGITRPPMHADECRRHAPVVMTTGILPETVWPETDEEDWCGEWEAREEGEPPAA
jgi:hypothetical protein